MTIFYTSDNHFFHENIIKFSQRPFKDAEEMNYQMIQRWNEIVKPDDMVYNLGDFGFAPQQKLENVLTQLNGTKFLIRGNHDKVAQHLKGWAGVYDYKELYDEGTFVVLFHYGQRVWNKSHFKSLHFYGHSHGTLPGNSLSCDVGVDCWNFYPVTLQSITQRLKTLPKYDGFVVE